MFFAAFSALLLSGPLFLTQVWGYSVLQAGFAVAVGPVMAAITAAIFGRLTDRLGPAAVGAPGGLLFARSAVSFITRLGAEPSYVAGYLPGQLLGGAGVGLILPSFTAVAAATLQPERLSTGLGAVTTFRQIGAALGVGAWVALVGTRRRPRRWTPSTAACALMGACAVASTVVLAVLAGPARAAPATAQPASAARSSANPG